MVLLLAACATSGGVQAPRWISVPPSPTQQYTYFVGSGSDSSGVLSAAQQKAEAALAGEIVRTAGGGSQAKLTAAQAGELSRFEQQIRSGLSSPPAAGQPEVAVFDRFVQRDGAKVTVYLLGRVLSSALRGEQERLRPAGRVEGGGATVSGATTEGAPAGGAAAPSEQQSEELSEPGTPLEAAKAYLAAAIAAAGTQGADRPARFERDVRKAEEAIGEINLEKLTDALAGLIHKSLPSPFRLRVTGADGSPLAGAAILATYKSASPTGALSTVTEHLRTDASGVAELNLPPLTFIGAGKVSMALDLHADLASLEGLGAGYQPTIARLARAIQAKSVEFSYAATSESAAIRTGVLVVDVDGVGNFIWGDATTSGLVEALAPLGFKLTTVPGNPSVVGIDDPDLLMIVRNNFGGQFRRVMLGQAVITAFRREAGGGFRVEVAGKLKVTDLATGDVLATASRVASGKGSTAVSAINAAFNDLGALLGTEIANRLP